MDINNLRTSHILTVNFFFVFYVSVHQNRSWSDVDGVARDRLGPPTDARACKSDGSFLPATSVGTLGLFAIRTVAAFFDAILADRLRVRRGPVPGE